MDMERDEIVEGGGAPEGVPPQGGADSTTPGDVLGEYVARVRAGASEEVSPIVEQVVVDLLTEMERYPAVQKLLFLSIAAAKGVASEQDMEQLTQGVSVLELALDDDGDGVVDDGEATDAMTSALSPEVLEAIQGIEGRVGQALDIMTAMMQPREGLGSMVDDGSIYDKLAEGLQAGMPPKEIVDALIAEGATPQEAQEAVEEAVAVAEEPTATIKEISVTPVGKVAPKGKRPVSMDEARATMMSKLGGQ